MAEQAEEGGQGGQGGNAAAGVENTLARAKRLGAPDDIDPQLAPYWVRLKESRPTLVFDRAYGLRLVGDDNFSKYGGLFDPFIKYQQRF